MLMGKVTCKRQRVRSLRQSAMTEENRCEAAPDSAEAESWRSVYIGGGDNIQCVPNISIGGHVPPVPISYTSLTIPSLTMGVLSSFV